MEIINLKKVRTMLEKREELEIEKEKLDFLVRKYGIMHKRVMAQSKKVDRIMVSYMRTAANC